jgi:predicted nucleotidyltransferase
MFESLIARLASELEARAIPYMVIGGQAVLVHGEPRLTRDIDITVGVTTDHLDAVIAAADAVGLTMLVESPREFVRDTWVLPCEQPDTGIRVDLVFSFSQYEQQAIERTIRIPLGGRLVRYASAEDLIVQKIVAGRPRDLEDARTVLLKHSQLDRDYILRCLTALGAETGLPVLERYAALQTNHDKL